jgi:phage repressor protein C with HTH and peptisase S24 domain
MAKRKEGSKVQKRGKLPRGKSAKRGKARKVSKAAKETKRSGAKTKPKRAPVKKVARKVKQPVALAVETATVEVIERPVAVTEIVETEVREVPDEPDARQA